MEVAVRVMSRGQEIDRITRPLRMDGGRPAVTYRKLLWPVENGCIHIETEHDATRYQGNANLDDWVELVTRVLPESLPTHINDCTEVLRACFRENLPHGVIQQFLGRHYAISTKNTARVFLRQTCAHSLG